MRCSRPWRAEEPPRGVSLITVGFACDRNERNRVGLALQAVVEAGQDGNVEGVRIRFGSIRGAESLAGLDAFLKSEELAFLDEVEELFEVFRQGSARGSHGLCR